MNTIPPGSSVHGILQARILEWVVSSFSRGSSQPRDRPGSPTLQADLLPFEPPGKQVSKKKKKKNQHSFLQLFPLLESLSWELSYHAVREPSSTWKEGPHIAAPLTADINYQTYDSTSPWMTPVSNVSATSFDAEKRDVLPFLDPAQLQICEQNKYSHCCH